MRATQPEPERVSESNTTEAQRFENALRNTPIILFEHDCQLRYTWIFNPNPKFGNTAEQIIGKTDAELLTPHRARQLTEIKQKVLTGGKGARQEVAVPMDRQTLYFDLIVEPLRNSSDRIVGLACATFDITERRQLEEALQEVKRSYATAAHLAGLGYFVQNFENDTVYWSPETYRILGVAPREPAPSYSQYLSMVHPDDRKHLADRVHKARAFGMECVTEYRIRRPDGQERTIRAILQPIPHAKGRSTEIRGTLQDITRETFARQKLSAMNQMEREAVFRDLHDTVCQELSGIGFLADSVREGLELDPQAALQDVDKIIASTKRAIDLARNIARNLKPLSNEPGALATALVELAAYVESIYGIRCRVSSDRNVHIADSLISTQLLLIAREATINAARHAKAREIRITLTREDNTAALRVADNGRGLSELENGQNLGGLAIMTSRAELIGAQMNIRPAGGGGTTVECTWKQNHESSTTIR